MGQLFEMDYPAVSRAVKRFEQESKVNHEIGEIKEYMGSGFTSSQNRKLRQREV